MRQSFLTLRSLATDCTEHVQHARPVRRTGGGWVTSASRAPRLYQLAKFAPVFEAVQHANGESANLPQQNVNRKCAFAGSSEYPLGEDGLTRVEEGAVDGRIGDIGHVGDEGMEDCVEGCLAFAGGFPVAAVAADIDSDSGVGWEWLGFVVRLLVAAWHGVGVGLLDLLWLAIRWVLFLGHSVLCFCLLAELFAAFDFSATFWGDVDVPFALEAGTEEDEDVVVAGGPEESAWGAFVGWEEAEGADGLGEELVNADDGATGNPVSGEAGDHLGLFWGEAGVEEFDAGAVEEVAPEGVAVFDGFVVDDGRAGFDVVLDVFAVPFPLWCNKLRAASAKLLACRQLCTVPRASDPFSFS